MKRMFRYLLDLLKGKIDTRLLTVSGMLVSLSEEVRSLGSAVAAYAETGTSTFLSLKTDVENLKREAGSLSAKLEDVSTTQLAEMETSIGELGKEMSNLSEELKSTSSVFTVGQGDIIVLPESTSRRTFDEVAGAFLRNDSVLAVIRADDIQIVRFQ